MERSQLSATIDELAGPRIQKLQSVATVMGIAGLALTVLSLLTNRPAAFQSLLFAYMFWIGISLGSLGFLLLHHAVGGGWGFLIRRFIEAGSSPVVFAVMGGVLALILFGGMHDLYHHWMDAETVAKDPVLSAKAPYLNQPFFVLRAVIYFALWIGLSALIRKWSAPLERERDMQAFNRLNLLGGFGILIYVLSVTFMSVDWVMSLTPHWFSSIIGLLYTVMQALSTLALMIVLWAFLMGGGPLEDEAPKGYFRDLGNLMLATVLLWAYMSFSQYLIQYSGNLAEEAPWYSDRRQNWWGVLSLGLIPFHFALPFLVLLLGSHVKRSPRRMAQIAAFIIFMRFVDLFWWVAPTFRDTISVTFSDIGAPLLIGGIWLFLWVGQLRGKTLVPLHDPRLEEGLHGATEHA
jgi:hypothetical protein